MQPLVCMRSSWLPCFLVCTAVIRVNPTFELLGWYACGAATTMEHVAIHTQFSTLNESPLFLLLNPSGVSPEARELPMDIFITDYHGASTSTSTRCGWRSSLPLLVCVLLFEYLTMGGHAIVVNVQAARWCWLVCHTRLRLRRARE